MNPIPPPSSSPYAPPYRSRRNHSCAEAGLRAGAGTPYLGL